MEITSSASLLSTAEEKQAILAAIIESSHDAIVSKTLRGIITSWNPAAEEMFGYTETEAVGRHISLIIPADRLEEETYIIGQVVNGNKVDHFETVRITKNGELVPISLTVSPVTDRKGRIIGASKIARDISGQHAVRDEKARLYLRLKELNDKKDEFIGLASHELRTPLTSINGYLQILAQRITNDKDKQFLQKACRQVAKLSSLVNDLLDVSKIEAGKLQFSIENFNIREVVDDAIQLISHTSPHYEVTLHSGISELTVRGDADRIEQVLINLLTNAIRYAPASSQAEVYLIQESDHVKIGVRDFGQGIPQDKLSNIFLKFFRVDNIASTVSGLGIGLYLCHEIIARHHGSIWAESEHGKGSTFWFTLPF